MALGLASGVWVHEAGLARPRNFGRFAAYYVWMPWNIFIGPARRGDDPGGNLEEGAVRIVGQPVFDMIANVHDLMRRYLNGEDLSSHHWTLLDSLLAQLMNSHSRPHALRPDDWGVDATGRYFIREP